MIDQKLWIIDVNNGGYRSKKDGEFYSDEEVQLYRYIQARHRCKSISFGEALRMTKGKRRIPTSLYSDACFATPKKEKNLFQKIREFLF